MGEERLGKAVNRDGGHLLNGRGATIELIGWHAEVRWGDPKVELGSAAILYDDVKLTLEIPPAVQRELAREAKARGIAIPALAARLLPAALARPITRATGKAPRAERQIRCYQNSLTEFSDQIPALPDETFSRTMIYQDHD